MHFRISIFNKSNTNFQGPSRAMLGLFCVPEPHPPGIKDSSKQRVSLQRCPREQGEWKWRRGNKISGSFFSQGQAGWFIPPNVKLLRLQGDTQDTE